MFRSVISSGAPPLDAWTVVQDAAGGDQAVYIGKARSVQPPATLTVTSVSKAAAASFAVTAHGLASGNAVTIAGATGDWAACNGSQLITVTGTGTFTIAVNSGGFSDSFDGVVTTTAPRTSAAIWSIMYQTLVSGFATVIGNCSGTTAADKIWDNRATYGYQ